MGSLFLIVVFAVLLPVAVMFFRFRRRYLSQFENLGPDGIRQHVGILLRRGYDGAVTIFTDMQSNRFVQFRKYIRGSGEIGVEMHFPRAPWSEPYYESFHALLVRQSVSFEVLPVPTPPTTEFTHIDFGIDAEQASRVAVAIFADIFGCQPVRVRVNAEDINPLDETIDRRDYPRQFEILARRIFASKLERSKPHRSAKHRE